MATQSLDFYTNLPWKVESDLTFGTVLLDARATGVTWTKLTVEISKDGGSYTACTNDPVEIGSTGTYTLTLTSGEMTAEYCIVRLYDTGLQLFDETFIHINTIRRENTGSGRYDLVTSAEVGVWTADSNDYTTGRTFGRILGYQEGVCGAKGLVPSSPVSTTTVVYSAISAGVDGDYDGMMLVVEDNGGSGGQGTFVSRRILTYESTSGKFTLEEALPFTPALNDTVMVMAYAPMLDSEVDAISDTVWDELLSGHTTASTFGKAVADIETDVTAILVDTGTTLSADIAALNDLAIADVQTALTNQGYTSGRAPNLDDLDAAITTRSSHSAADVQALLNDPTAAAIADAVWDEATSAHVSAGTFGLALGTTIQTDLSTVDTNVSSVLTDTGTTLPAQITSEINDVQTDIAALNDPTAAAISDAVWDELASGHVTASTFGKILQDLETNLATVDTNVDSILVDTDVTIPGLISALNDLSAAAAADAVWDELLSGHVTASTFGKAIADTETDVTAILVDTGTTLPATLATLATSAEIAALNDLSAAQVNTEVDTALTDLNLDKLLTAAVVGADVTDNSVFAKLVSSSATADWDTFVNTTDSLQAIADSTAPTAAVIADAVWDEAVAGHVAAGSFGAEVQLHALSSEVSGLATAAALSTVDTNVSSILTDTGTTLPAQITSEINDVQTDIAALNDITSAAVADAVWEELIADHSGTSGSTAEALSNATAPTAAAVADAVWDELASGHVTALTFGKILQDLETNLATVDSNVDAILVDTGTTIPATITTVDANVDAILVDTDVTIPGLISALNDPTVAAIADGIWDEAVAGHVAGGSFGAEVQLHALSSEVSGLATAAALSTVDTNVSSILTDTGTTLPAQITSEINDVQTDIAALNDLSAAQVNTEVDTALTDIKLDKLIFSAVVGADVTDDSIIAQIVSASATADWDTFDNTTDSLEALAAGGGAPTAAAIADAVWDELLSGHVTASTFGKAVADIETDAAAILVDTGTTLPATLATLATSANLATVDANVDAILVDTDVTIPGLISGLNDPTAAAIADAVWDELTSGHAVVGSFGEEMTDLTAALAVVDTNVDSVLVDTDATIPGLISGLNDPTAAAIADAVWLETLADHSGSSGSTAEQLASISALGIADSVWNEATSSHVTAGTYGLALGTTVPADIVTIDGIVDSILVDTGTTLDAALAVVDANVDSILVDTGTTLPATLTTIDTNVDAILVDTGTSIPGLLSTIEGKIDTVDTNVDSILVDTGTTLPATLATIDANVDAILVDTGTTLPATLATLATSSALATVDTNVDSILVDTDVTIPGLIAALNDFDATATGVFLSTAGNNSVADQVWEEAIADHSGTAGSTAEALDAIATAPTAAAIADAVWDELLSGHVTASTFGKAVADIETDATAILVDTGTTLPATLATLATAADLATVDGIVDSILVDTGTTLPAEHATLATSAALATVDGIVDSILVDTDVTIPGLIAGLNDITAAAAAVAVWDALTASHVTASTFGLEVQGHALSSEVTGLATAAALATVDSNVDAILVDTGTTLPATLATLATSSALATVDGNVDAILVDTGTTLPATLSTIEGKIDTIDTNVDSILVDTDATIPGLISALNDPTAAVISDAVWDEILSGHVIVGSAGEALGAVAAPPSAATIADAVWDELLSGHTTSSTFGKALADIETDAAAILVDTGTTIPAQITSEINDVQADIAALNDLSITDVQTALDAQGYTSARASKLDNLDAAVSTVNSAVGALNDIAIADVQTALTNQGLTSVRAALLDNLDAAISTVVTAVAALNDISSADVQTALTSQGYTTTRAPYLDNLTTILTTVERNRKIHGNKVVIAADDLSVDVYNDAGTSVDFSFTISADGRTRTPD